MAAPPPEQAYEHGTYSLTSTTCATVADFPEANDAYSRLVADRDAATL